MEIQLHNTTKIVMLDGVPARVWEGYTASGTRIHAYITRIAVKEGDDQEDFYTELAQTRAPSPQIDAIPLRLIL